jgi:hypothetical protein
MGAFERGLCPRNQLGPRAAGGLPHGIAEPATLESTRDSGRGWPACGKAGPATLELHGGEVRKGGNAPLRGL